MSQNCLSYQLRRSFNGLAFVYQKQIYAILKQQHTLKLVIRLFGVITQMAAQFLLLLSNGFAMAFYWLC